MLAFLKQQQKQTLITNFKISPVLLITCQLHNLNIVSNPHDVEIEGVEQKIPYRGQI